MKITRNKIYENTRNNVNETKREKGVNIKGDVYGAQKAFKNATKITLVNAFRKALMYGMVITTEKKRILLPPINQNQTLLLHQ